MYFYFDAVGYTPTAPVKLVQQIYPPEFVNNKSKKEKLRYWFGMRLVVIVILEENNMNLQKLLLFIFTF